MHYFDKYFPAKYIDNDIDPNPHSLFYLGKGKNFM